jgi:hypothetical protein
VIVSSVAISRNAWGLNGSSEAPLAEDALNRVKGLEKALTAITRLLFFKKDLLVISVCMV